MTLRRLELLGFKSFAGRVVLEFDHGVTVVVGPNGSGKSNIADAVRWALGEQNPRLVRGKRAEDVIFAGSASRKPLGMAEVSLVLDNADGRLPSEFTEVRVSRRLYRSGESEYLLNGARTRLRDVADLLLRVGLGPDSYCVVGQGAIDELILQRPEERRVLLESAADVRRYRLQIAETASRLAAAEQNLARCRDIKAELEPLERRLRQQAERAERIQAVQDELGRVAIAWFRYRLDQAQAALGRAEDERSEAEALLRASENEVGRQEAAWREQEARLRQVEERLEDALRQALEAERALHRLERQQTEARTREATLIAQADGYRREAEQLAARAAQLQRERDEADARAQEAAQAAARALQDLGNREQEHRRCEREVEQRREALQRCEAELARAESNVAKQQRLLDEVERAQRAEEQRLRELRARLEERRSQLGEEERVRERLEARLQQVETARQALAAEWEAARTARATAEERLTESARNAREAERRVVELAERLRGLESLAGLALPEGAQALERAGVEGMLGLLGARLVAPEGLEAALAAALGERLNAIAFRDWRTAKQGLRRLAEGQEGAGAVVAPIGCDPRSSEPTARLLERVRAVDPDARSLADLVEVDPEAESLLRPALSQILLVSDLDAALAAASQLWGASAALACEWTLVTRGGEAVRADGVARAGRDLGSEALAARGREESEARAALARAEEEREQAGARLVSVEEQYRQVEALERELGQRHAALLAEARLAGDAARQTEQRLSERRADLARLQRQVESAEQRLVAIGAERSSAAGRLHQAREERTALQRTCAAAREALAKAREALERASSALLAARNGADQAGAAARALRATVTRLDSELSAVERQRGEALHRLAECERERTTLRLPDAAAIAAEDERQRVASAEAERWRDERRRLQTESDTAERALAALRVDVERARARREAAALAAHRARDELTRLARDLAQHVDDDSLGEVVDLPRQLRLRLDALAPPDATETLPSLDPEWLRRRMAQLQREARALGSVGPNAIEEYRAVAERYRFLEEQIADLEHGMEELRRAMADLEALATQRFCATFEAVNQAFQECFVALFGGGTASLALSDPQSPLEGGIDVVARPPGKRLQSLLALSGGERSLAMIALLLALLKVAPAPFCVLDEVDAALDDANVKRFLAMLREFQEQTRFVLISHNRATMEQADRLYGVSMDGSGVSRVVVVSPAERRGEGSRQVAAAG